VSSAERPCSILAVAHGGAVSGAEKVLLAALTDAAAQGWRVCCLSPNGALARRLADAGIDRRWIPELKLPSGPRPWAALVLLVRNLIAAFVVRRYASSADLVVSNGLLALPSIRIASPRVPVTWIVHDVIYKRGWLALVRLCRSVVTEAIAVSEAAAAPLQSLGLTTRVVRHGTAWPVPAAPPSPVQPPVIGCVAALTSWKGQDVLLDAVAQMARTDVRVELVGIAFPKDGPYVRLLEQRAARADLADRVRFHGWVEDPLARVRGWSVAVSASVEPEAGPLSMLEAMSVGVPAVGTRLGGTAELLSGIGLLVPARQPAAMAEAIERLLDDEQLRRRCRASGLAAVEARYSLRHHQDVLRTALAEIARNGRSRRGASGQATVVFAVPDFDPAFGGTSRQTRQQAEALIRRGSPARVLTRQRDRSWPRHDRVHGIEVDRVGRASRSALAEKLGLVSMMGWLLRHRRQVSVLQVVMYPDFALSAAAAGLLNRTSIIWAGHGDATDTMGPAPDPLRGLQRGVRRLVLRHCAHVALTPAIVDELRALGMHRQIHHISTPVDTGRFRVPTEAERVSGRALLPVADDDFVIVYTGHFRTLKGVDQLVEAFRRFLDTGRRGHLVLVGGSRGADDDREADLRGQVQEAGMAGHVTFTGIVANVEQYLWAADVFVLPSVREGLSNSVLEAMACALPCVVPVTAEGHQVLDAESGIVPPDNRPEGLLDALVTLADDRGTRVRMGSAAAKRAQAFSVDQIIRRYAKMYDGLGPGAWLLGHRGVRRDGAST